jgi:hypothetical protein
MIKLEYDNETTNASQDVRVSKQTIRIVRDGLKNIHSTLGRLIDLLRSEEELGEVSEALQLIDSKIEDVDGVFAPSNEIEGVFDGERMIAQDGNAYEVPANYISKSKLLEGDILKKTTGRGGRIMFKQIMPVDRKRAVGTLAIDNSSGSYYVMADGHAFKVIPAAVTFYRGEIGDECVILVPKDAISNWAAIEMIVKR